MELLGIKVTIEEKEVEDSSSYTNKKQLVIDQSVKQGEKLSKGEKIVLYIPKILSTYPDMVTDSWTLDRAEEFCEKYGLTIKVTYKESDGEENIILAQSPKAGEEVFDGETFKVVVSKKPEATTTTTKAVTDGEE